MCHNCPPKKNCFEVEVPHCDEGCKDVLSTDCIFHNITNEDQSAKLFNIGVTKGSSLKYILKQIDGKLELLITTDFRSFNLNGLSGEIETIKQFSELITLELKKLRDVNIETYENFTEIEQDLLTLFDKVDKLININVSNSELSIVSTDTLKTVLNKIIDYTANININSVLVSGQFQDSDSVDFSVSGGVVRGEIKISEQQGNILSVQEDGLYATNQSISNILQQISTNPDLKAVFASLVASTTPPATYDIMSDDNTPIEYISSKGVKLTAQAKANVLLQLKDVKHIITPPNTTLRIVNKGTL